MNEIMEIFFLGLLINVMKFTKKKLVTLMMLELLMLMLILLFTLDHFSMKNAMFYLLIFSVFMVLDSVFAICTLIFNTRNNSIMNSTKILF